MSSFEQLLVFLIFIGTLVLIIGTILLAIFIKICLECNTNINCWPFN